MNNTQQIQSEQTKQWMDTHLLLCKVPQRPIAYSPKRLNLFSIQGQQMVESLAAVGPLAFKDFAQQVNIDAQRKLAIETFESLKGTKFDKPGKKGNLGYFRTKITFDSLVPMEYKRTPLAPRLTAKGNSFHGMNKALLIKIVQKLTEMNQQMFVLELDMSACHSRVASSLLPPNSELNKLLTKSKFWETQVNEFLPLYTNEGIEMNLKMLKRILKVFLYTSLNGGNPASQERLIDNLTGNAMEILPKDNLTKSKVFTITKGIAEDFKLVLEVKDLNKECYTLGLKRGYTFTVDRFDPYINDQVYKGISRVLQGFEVCLLSVLTLKVMQMNFIPLSLDHDGLMAMTLLDKENINCKKEINQIVKETESLLSESLNEWSDYLMKASLPIEAKRHWFQSEVVEY